MNYFIWLLENTTEYCKFLRFENFLLVGYAFKTIDSVPLDDCKRSCRESFANHGFKCFSLMHFPSFNESFNDESQFQVKFELKMNRWFPDDFYRSKRTMHFEQSFSIHSQKFVRASWAWSTSDLHGLRLWHWSELWINSFVFNFLTVSNWLLKIPSNFVCPVFFSA